MLPIQNINSWIPYPSPYSKGEKGYKQLNVSELSHLFGFPSTHCRLNLSTESFPVAPLQVLDALLAPVYETLAPQHTSSTRLEIHKDEPKGAATYLPSIGKILPHIWRTASTHSDGAAEADDSIILTYIWDNRITSIYPMFTSLCLNTFRSALFGISFQAYI